MWVPRYCSVEGWQGQDTTCTCARAACSLPRNRNFLWCLQWGQTFSHSSHPTHHLLFPPDLGHRWTGAIPLHGVHILQRLRWLHPGFWCHWPGVLWSSEYLAGWCLGQNHSNGAVLPHGGTGEQDWSGRSAGTIHLLTHSPNVVWALTIGQTLW